MRRVSFLVQNVPQRHVVFFNDNRAYVPSLLYLHATKTCHGMEGYKAIQNWFFLLKIGCQATKWVLYEQSRKIG